MKTAKLIAMAALVAFTASPAVAAGKAEGDAGVAEALALCKDGSETAALACRTRDDRLIAVCAGADGALRLAFQTAGQPDTLVSLPADEDRKAVSTGFLAYSRGGGSYARFGAGKVDYVAYSGMGDGWEQAGLSEVDAAGATDDYGEPLHLAEHVCLPASRSYDAGFPLFAEKAGQVVEEQATFDIPVEE